jgi:ABC-2 type transport system permease protein
VGLVAFFAAYAVAGTILGDLDNRHLAALLDPFGFASFALETRYWTTIERNTRAASLSGPLLLNRLIWMGVALAVLAATFARFRFSVAPTRRERKRLRHGERAEPALVAPPQLALPAVSTRHDTRALLTAFISQTRLEIRRVIGSVAFPIIVAFGVLNLIGNATVIDQMFGTSVYPVTHLMLQTIQGGYLLFVVIIATLYAGEMVWRDRQAGMSDVVDALPVATSALWAPKLLALLLILGLVLAAGGLTTIGIQLYRGYTHFELALYAKGLFLEVGIPFAQMAVLALLAQVLTNQKFIGYGVMILYFISQPVLGALDFDHYLYRYASAPAAPYSDMNGYGHFVQPLFWFYLYWSIAAGIFLVLVHLFWVRGRETGAGVRTRLAWQRLRGPVRGVLAACLAAFIATGAWIYYNTNILNEYVTDDQARDRIARYEKEYKQHSALAQPRISSVYAEVDIFPERRDVEIRGRYVLVNRTDSSIARLHVLIPREVTVRALDGVGSPEHEDATVGYRIFELPAPLAPGDSITMSFQLVVDTRGFALDDGLTEIVHNGTFFNNYDFFPHIGYSSAIELQDPNERRKRDLPPIERMPRLEDETARRNNYISSQADWIDFETIVSTSPDQIALAPGYLQREWTDEGRRYFHYRMDAPILGFFSYLSADWQVARDRWNDVDIEVYYHRAHTYNVERMIFAVKKSLDYFTQNFGPYQHRQVRIVEFPRYATFAQSFPNTIPYSESIGFIARLDEDDDEPIDYVFYVTAHEVAHQWWAHQVIGAEVQGATVTSETMAQYSALMVMEKEYGPDLMRRFLEYELDGYLAGRGGELIEELPLLRVENQPYIHYRKGSLVMYRIRDLFGEDSLNTALSRYIARVKFQQPPYTTSAELLAAVREATPEGQEGVLEDLFETITLWDVRARSATWTARSDSTWSVRLAIDARKLRASGAGEESEVPLDDWIELGVFGEQVPGGPAHGRPLHIERRRITAADSVIELIVRAQPRRAGIDPYNKLIDRNPDDNVRAAVEAPRN